VIIITYKKKFEENKGLIRSPSA